MNTRLRLRVMSDSAEIQLQYWLRPALAGDYAFAEALMHANMNIYYVRHGLVWRPDLFHASWLQSENYILDAGGQPIGFLRLSVEGDSLHLRDVQVAEGWRGQGAGTYLLDISHRWARARGLNETQLRVFVDNPALGLYKRMGYRLAGSHFAQFGSIRHMVRPVDR